MWRQLIGCLCLAGLLMCGSAGCDQQDDTPGTVDPTSDFESQTRYDEAYDQQPHGVGGNP